MENKTAVQQVFSELEALFPNYFNVYTTEGKEFINHFHKFLAIEKKQMALCYEVGIIDGNNGEKLEFEQYYNETFNN